VTNHEAAKHDIDRAGVIFGEAKSLFRSGHWNLVVRRAQETVELALKGCLRWAGVEVPRMHDVGPLLRQTVERFPEDFGEMVPRLASISRSLRAEREISFYGDPASGLPPEALYGEEDAAEAIGKATLVLKACSKLRMP